jgi:hypothetical protein
MARGDSATTTGTAGKTGAAENNGKAAKPAKAPKLGKDGKPKTGRLAQLRETYRMAKRQDRYIGWISIGSGLAVVLAFVLVGLFWLNPWILGFLGLSAGLLVAAFIFGRRAERAAYAQIEGQPGAAAAVLNSLRRGWTVTPAIGITRQQDVVHRAVGRCGIVLVGEGAPSRVSNLLANEKRRHARVAPGTPIYDVIVGDAEQQVPLRSLSKHLSKLPRAIRPADVTDINYRLKALAQAPVPIPKGPLPKSPRMPKGARFK